VARIAAVALCLLALLAGTARAGIVCPDATSPCQSGSTYGIAITSATAVALLTNDGNRKSLVIQNQPGSASPICVAMGVVATNTAGLCNGFVLNAGTPFFLANFSMGNTFGGVWTSAVSIIGMTGNANVGYAFSD
jgi:hypothetical protein